MQFVTKNLISWSVCRLHRYAFFILLFSLIAVDNKSCNLNMLDVCDIRFRHPKRPASHQVKSPLNLVNCTYNAFLSRRVSTAQVNL